MSAEPSAAWRELLSAVEFARDRFSEWGKDGLVASHAAKVLADDYAARRDAYTESARLGKSPPADVYVPPLDAGPEPLARAARNWRFLDHELRRLESGGRLTLAESHACLDEVHSRLAFLRKRLGTPRPPVSAPPRRPEAPMVMAVPDEPRRSFMELLLDPRSIQWFLAFGGGLFVLGFVLWLYTKGIFENKLVVASALGIANAGLLFGGWALILRTRYQLAGRALTLLACLVMPLNLWFYHAQGLVTLDGHLWVAGVVVCAFYAASAWLLKDWMFVPVLMGGVTMTGLLLLADLGKFWEIAAPSTFLVALGLVGIHVERAFAPGEGPFSRRRFGLAFFFSGHVALAGGLLLLLGAQIAGNWLHPLFLDIYQNFQAKPSPIITEHWGRLLALGLVIAGVYAHLYSDLVVRRLGLYVALAAVGLLWAEVLVLELLRVEVGAEVILATLAATAAALNLAARGFTPQAARGYAPDASPRPPRYAWLGLGLALVPVLFGIVLHMRATNTLLPTWRYDGGWAFVGAMAVTWLSCRLSAHLYRHSLPRLAAIYFFATAATELVGAAGILRQLGLTRWEDQAWVLMLIPIAHALAAKAYRAAWAAPVLAAGHAGTVVMLASSAATTLQSFTTVHTGATLNLLLALFFLLAAVFYFLTATLHRQPGGVYLATVTACAAVWQVLMYAGVPDEYYALTFAVLGLGLLIGYRLGMAERSQFGRAKAVFDSANGLLSVAFVASALMGLSRLAFHDVRWLFVGLCATLTVAAVLAAGLVRHAAWRRWYVLAAVGQGLLTLLAVQALSTLTGWQKAELFSVAAGAVLLAVGHLGWLRERERESDFVSFALGLGSLLVAVPLVVAVIYHRSTPHFSWPDEMGLLAGGLILLGTGFVSQLKATTLAGASMTTVYVATLLLYARGLLEQVQTAALLLAIGGGLIFGTGLLLAVCRDRLLAMPAKVRNREGVFRVLSWR